MKTTYETGLLGEQAAENWLLKNRNMICLERRYRTKAGEIDLIMQEGETIVFVEVKARKKADPGIGIFAVDRRKQDRITRASVLYLMRKEWMNRSVRYDIVEINHNGIIHIPNAFQPGGMFFG